MAPRAAPKPRLGSARRPTGKAGGLGVKRMATKVDESLFDQAPEEAAPAPTPVVRLLFLTPLTNMILDRHHHVTDLILPQHLWYNCCS